MHAWRHTARTIVATFLVTSAGWLIGGAVLFDRLRQPETQPLRAAPAMRGEPAQLSQAAFTAAAPRAEPGGLVVPVAGVRPDQLVDTFTQAREGGRRHDAIDIMAPQGTPVIAAAAGTVEKLFASVRGGNTVYVRSPDRRRIYYYAHLDRYAPGLVERRRVRQGEQLGTVGSTGSASPDAPHLHFEIQVSDPAEPWWRNRGPLNPYPLLGGRG